MTNTNSSLPTRIFNILATDNGLAESIYATIEERIIVIKSKIYKEEMRDFFEVDLDKKTLDFSEFPKSSTMEQKCIGLANYLEKGGYEIKGLCNFIKNPRFKPQPKGMTEFSLY